MDGGGESPPRMSFVAAPSSDACVHPLHGDESSPEARVRALHVRGMHVVSLVSFRFSGVLFSLSLSLFFSFFSFLPVMI